MFSQFKIYIAGAIAGLLAIFGVIFYKRGRDIETLEKDVELEKVKTKIAEENTKVVEKVVEEKEKVVQYKDEVQQVNIEAEKEEALKKVKIHEQIQSEKVKNYKTEKQALANDDFVRINL